MAELSVAIPYAYDEGWVAGAYVVQNLLHALKRLEAERRPRVHVLTPDPAAFDALAAATGYPDLHRVDPSRLRVERRSPLKRLHDRLRYAGLPRIDLILFGPVPFCARRTIQWIPDFQELLLPRFFPADEIEARRLRNESWLASSRHVMLSSEAVAADFRRFYPGRDNRLHVVPFASFEDGRPDPGDAAILARLGLPDDYFVCANQMWMHKNHAVVIAALERLAAAGHDTPPVVFTGKEADYRHPGFPEALKAGAAHLGRRAIFLGFLPRAHQMAVLRRCRAVIQPSLCEGWSTVVEDARAAGRFVVASDIPVHREQLRSHAAFFPAGDAEALAAAMRAPTPGFDPAVYETDRQRYAERLSAMMTSVAAEFAAAGTQAIRIAPV